MRGVSPYSSQCRYALAFAHVKEIVVMKINRILVANDSYEGMEPALEKAAVIEHYTGAEVEVATVVYDPIDEQAIPEVEKARLIEAFMAAERAGLRHLLEPFRDKIAWSEPRVLWGKRAEDAILDEVRARDIDLVIKPMAETGGGVAGFLHTPLDWRLIRNATVPVLISKSEEWRSDGPILVALDAADQKHRDLNEKLLDTTAAFARVLNAPVRVVSAYPDLGQGVNDYQVAVDFEGIKREMRASLETELKRLVETSDLDNAVTDIFEGTPATVIDGVVDEHKPSLVILGTSAHSGVAKLLLGNTVEKILPRIAADVVTLR
jgi:nucleotide-binding universal stress UspA family protein